MIGAKLIEAAGNGISTVAVAEAIDFDGTNDYLSRASDLVGNTDSKTFTFSAWVWYDGTSLGEIFQTEAAGTKGLRVYMNGTQIIARIYNSAGTLLGQLTAGLVAEKTFCNILISCDTNATTWAIYVNDVLAQTGTPTNALIDFAGYTPEIAGPRTGYFDGRLSNVFLDYTYRDLSIEANRRLFVTADLKPAAGQAALNPIMYLPMSDPTAPGVNAGTGGNFTLTGTVARSGRGPNQYNAPYSDFDGSADYLSRTTALTGIADSKTFTISCCFSSGASYAMQFLIIATSTTTRMYATLSAGLLDIAGYNSSGTLILRAQYSTAIVAGRNYHLVASFDLSNTANRYVYLNGQALTMTYSTYTDQAIDFSVASTPVYRVGRSAGTTYTQGKLGALWFNTSYIDLSVPANLAKFVTGTGIDAKPVDLGANGELPTGTSPLIYLPMYGNNAGRNYGTGGDFTVNSGPYTGARGPNEYWGNRADFNGTTGYLSRTSALAGIADSKTFSVSFNYNPDTIPATQDYIFAMSDGTDNRGIFIQLSGNTLRFFAYTSAGVNILIANATSPTLVAGTNYSVQASFDLANTLNRSIYINGAVATVTYPTYTNNTINHTASTQRIGAAADGSAVDFIDGKLSEFYFTTDYIDFSQEANRLKFRDAFGNPVNLTQQIEDAAIPNPAIYMRFPPTAFGTNYGTGGNFTVNGTITDGGQL